MACENCSEEIKSATRHHNRALRTVNRGLRRRTERLALQGDELFAALCEVDVVAQSALRELWERGGFQPPIGPEDYEIIVERSIAALNFQREHDSHMSPVSDRIAD
jgi:hypothetical protein